MPDTHVVTDIVWPCTRLRTTRRHINRAPLSPAASFAAPFPQDNTVMSTSPPSLHSSPRSSTSSRSSDGGLPFPGSPSNLSFEVEHMPSKTSSTSSPRRRKLSSERECEAALKACLTLLSGAKVRPFTVSGKIPLDPSNLICFFRTKVSKASPLPGQRAQARPIGRDHALVGLPHRRGS